MEYDLGKCEGWRSSSADLSEGADWLGNYRLEVRAFNRDLSEATVGILEERIVTVGVFVRIR